MKFIFIIGIMFGYEILLKYDNGFVEAIDEVLNKVISLYKI